MHPSQVKVVKRCRYSALSDGHHSLLGLESTYAAQPLPFNSLIIRAVAPMAEWEVVNSAPEASEDQSVSGWLNARGLDKYAEKIVELTDAESLDDFKLLDAAGPPKTR